MRILIFGGSGNIGKLVIGELLRRDVRVRAVVRDPAVESARTTVLQEPGVELVQGDLERPQTLRPAFAGCDSAFVVTPHFPEMPALQGNAIDAAAAAGARVVRVSGWTPSVASDSTCPGGRAHWRTEEHLKASGAPYTILQCNYFMQNIVTRNASTIIADGLLAGPLADARISMVDANDIAAVAACALTTDDHAGKTYTLSGPAAVSYAQVTSTLSELLGRTIRYEDMEPDDFRRWMLENGRVEWEADHALAIFELYRQGAGELVTNHVEQVTGRPAGSLEAFLRRDIDSFRAPSLIG